MLLRHIDNFSPLLLILPTSIFSSHALLHSLRTHSHSRLSIPPSLFLLCTRAVFEALSSSFLMAAKHTVPSAPPGLHCCHSLLFFPNLSRFQKERSHFFFFFQCDCYSFLVIFQEYSIVICVLKIFLFLCVSKP